MDLEKRVFRGQKINHIKLKFLCFLELYRFLQ